MQRIERYGVIALVFLLVTILAVSLWGESKGDGFFSMFKSKKPAQAAVDKTGDKPIRNRPLGGQAGERMLPLATPEAGATPIDPNAQALVTPGTLPGATPPSGTQPTTPSGAPGTSSDPYAAVRGPGAPFQPAQPLTTPGGAIVRRDPPATPVTRPYKVKSGDTLGEIASRELGSSARWVDIQRLNKMIEPSKLQVGMTLELPLERGASKPAANVPSQVNGAHKYVVKSGDTLGQIATRELGSAARWTEIQSLNPGLDSERLKVGATLALPARGTVAKSTSRDVASLTPATTKKKSRVQ